MHSPHHQTRSRATHPHCARRILPALLGIGLLVAASTETPQLRADDVAPAAEPDQPKADELIRLARERLHAYKSIDTDIVQTVYFGARKKVAEGHYTQGSEYQLRLEFGLKIGTVEGKLLQVSDGQDLWSLYTVGDEVRLTRRKIGEILKEARKDGQTGASLMEAELGLGGLPEMFAAIDEATDFDKVTVKQTNGTKLYVLRGGWAKRFQDEFAATPALKPFTPNAVEIALDEQLFPRRIRYLRSNDASDERLVTLEFRNTKLNADVDPGLFAFETPTGIVPKDVTAEYIQKLQAARARRQQQP